MLTSYKLSYHARVERADRITAILTHVGLGTSLVSGVEPKSRHTIHLTSTGVMVVTDEKTKTIVTMYLPTVEKVYAMFQTFGYDHVLYDLDCVIQKNAVRYKWIAKI